MRMSMLLLTAPVALLLTSSAGSRAADSEPQPATSPYAYATNGVLDQIMSRGSKWKLVIDESNLGGKEVEVVEVTIPAGTTVPSHSHGSVEILYVLSGTYEHEVNGKRYRLTPGMAGIVRPGDKVRHIVPPDGPTKLLVIWAPGGEARALANAQGTKPAPVPEIKE